ncbi:MAG: hypothetical protein ACLUNJ_24630, partial [Enterocloster sp.]|uniref:hypothetical protein n=1 Tax=Enterocloster sp. TaxID=2719315 RepID=UPI003995F924
IFFIPVDREYMHWVHLLSGRPAVRIRSGTLDTEPKAWFYWVFGFFVLVILSKSDDRIVSLLTKIQFA